MESVRMPAAYLYDNDTLFKNASKHSAIGMALTIPSFYHLPKFKFLHVSKHKQNIRDCDGESDADAPKTARVRKTLALLAQRLAQFQPP